MEAVRAYVGMRMVPSGAGRPQLTIGERHRDSYHDCDAYRPPRFERVLVTGRACDMAVDLDRFTVTRRGTGEYICATAARYGRDCLARGATVGSDAEARRRAPEDVAAFARRVLKPETR
jgi:hypothetical protein